MRLVFPVPRLYWYKVVSSKGMVIIV